MHHVTRRRSFSPLNVQIEGNRNGVPLTFTPGCPYSVRTP